MAKFSRWSLITILALPLLLAFENCGGSMGHVTSSSSETAAESSSVAGGGCLDPDDQSVIPVGGTYTYFSRASGSSDDCMLAKQTSVCDADATLAPVPPAIHYGACTVVGGASSGTSSLGTVGPGTSAFGGSSTGFANALFHDDFESGTIDSSRWTISTPDCSGTGRITIDTAQAHSGTHSIRVDGGGSYCDHIFIHHAPITNLGNTIYARFFVRFAQALSNNHVTFLTMVDQGDGGKNMRMGGQSGILVYNRETNDATLPELSPQGIATSYVPQINRWTCVEVAIDQTARTLRTQVDSTSISGLTLNQTWAGSAWNPALQDFNLGWESYAGVSNTLWFDDIALSNQPIGCQ